MKAVKIISTYAELHMNLKLQ